MFFHGTPSFALFEVPLSVIDAKTIKVSLKDAFMIESTSCLPPLRNSRGRDLRDSLERRVRRRTIAGLIRDGGRKAPGRSRAGHRLDAVSFYAELCGSTARGA